MSLSYNDILAIQRIQREAHGVAVEHGFWPENTRNLQEALLLINKEVEEARLYLEKGELTITNTENGPQGFIVALADIVLRSADLAEGLNLSLGLAIDQKNDYNKRRPFLNGRPKLPKDPGELMRGQ